MFAESELLQERSHLTGYFANDYFRHKNDAKLEQDSTTVYRFKARPFNRKVCNFASATKKCVMEMIALSLPNSS